MNKLDLFPAFVGLIVSWETRSDRKGNDLVLWVKGVIQKEVPSNPDLEKELARLG